MNRRDFFLRAAVAAMAATLDPEDLLASTKTIFIPKSTYVEQAAIMVDSSWSTFHGVHHKNCSAYLNWKNNMNIPESQIKGNETIRFATPREVDAVSEGKLPECYSAALPNSAGGVMQYRQV